MPDDLLVVHWFRYSDFARLVKNYVSHGQGDMPLGEFLNLFRGFTSKPKASAVRKALPGVRVLSELDDGDIKTLHHEMRITTKEPSHNVLGSPVGEEHLVGALQEFYGPGGRSWYKSAKGYLNGAPAIVEAAVVEADGEGDLFVGVNHSPTYSDPLADTFLFAQEVGGYGIGGLLQDASVLSGERAMISTAAAVHIIAAAPTTLDRGKTRLSVDGPHFTIPLQKVLWSVSKDLHKEAKKRERDAAAAERDAERRARAQVGTEKRITKAEACYKVMEEAYAYSTGNEALPTTVRDLYYAVRNRLKRFGYDADELDYNYFSQTILPAYRREVRELPKVNYEPRGILHEPHDGKEVRLGTASVAEYNFPDYVYDKILYIEKQGRVGILQAANLDRRYDMALVGGQGYATEAVRKLFENAEEGEYQLFVLHDADGDGYGIARTLREETQRMPGYSVDVIDIGLHLEDALEMDKEPETFTRKKRLPEATEGELTDVEREHFVGEEHRGNEGKPYWVAKRVELNDLSSPELVEYVKRKLKERGVRPKLIPPEDALAERREKMFREKLALWVDRALAEILDTEELKKKMVEDFQERFKLRGARRWIETSFKRDATISWRDALNGTLDAAYKAKHKDALHDAVSRYIRESVAYPKEEE